MQVLGQAEPPTLQDWLTTAVPLAGAPLMASVEQLSVPQVVLSLISTGIVTDPPEHTVAVSA